MKSIVSVPPTRPAWVEIDVRQLRQNFEIINRARPAQVRLASVVKDDAYGHGLLEVSQAAIAAGASFLALSNLEEAYAIRSQGIHHPVLLLGERTEDELEWCVRQNVTCCINHPSLGKALGALGRKQGKAVPFHVKIDTGMSRYGLRWSDALNTIQELAAIPGLLLEGVMTHYAMSDELDKSFAMLQTERFQSLLGNLEAVGIRPPLRHTCNTGGFLDLPHAHFDMVRVGILPYGVYPSAVCRRLEGLKPVMSVKTRIAAMRRLQVGDTVGYGMHYKASSPRIIGVLPVGYGDGYPRVRNQGQVLVRGQKAPIIGGISMDAICVDLTDVNGVELWDEVVLMGTQGNESISVHDLASLKKSVSYDILTNWRHRLPRVYLNKNEP